MKRNNLISIAQQEQMGLRRSAQPSNFVPASRNPQPVQVLPPVQEIHYGLDVVPNATLVTEVRSSKVDAAQGYLLETTLLTFVFALSLVLAVRYVADWPLLGAGMYLSTLLLFAVLWGGSYVVHKFLSAEGVAYYESKNKWDVIRREQAARWRYYEKLNGHSKDGQ